MLETPKGARALRINQKYFHIDTSFAALLEEWTQMQADSQRRRKSAMSA
jgi:hypothetical protein